MKNILALCCCLAAFSCTTHMKITVDIFDRSAMVHSSEYKAVTAEDRPSCSALKTWRPRLIADGATIVKATKIAAFNDTTVQLFAGSFADNIIKKASTEGCIDNTLDLAKTKEIYSDAIDELLDSLEVDKNTITGLNPVISAVEVAFNDNLEGLFGTSIAKDKMASFVVKAPEYYWQKYDAKIDVIGLDLTKKQPKEDKASRINNTVVNTFFGNADIAVKMETPGYFVVKGVRLDANEAIKSSFKVLNQGIKYLSYASGIPVPAPATPAANTTNYINKLPEVAENDTLSLQMDVKEAMYKQEVRSLLSIIMSQREVLKTGSDSAARAAGGEIKEAYQKFVNAIKQ